MIFDPERKEDIIEQYKVRFETWIYTNLILRAVKIKYYNLQVFPAR